MQLDTRQNREMRVHNIDRANDAQIPYATPLRYDGPTVGDSFGWIYGIGTYSVPGRGTFLSTDGYPGIEYRYTGNMFREMLGITEKDYDDVLNGNGSIYSYVGKTLFYNGWNLFSLGLVGKQADRNVLYTNGDISEEQYWNASKIDLVTSLASLLVPGVVGNRVAGNMVEGFFSEFVSSAVAGVTYDIIQKGGEVATYNFTQDARQRIPYLGKSLDAATTDFISAANLTQLTADVALDTGLGWLMWVGSRNSMRAMHNSPNTANPTKVKVVEALPAADPQGLRGSFADSSSGRVLAAAGGELQTYSGQSLSLPARASQSLDDALVWMERVGAQLDLYVNKNATAMERALQAVRMQEDILIAARNSVSDGNALASLNVFHPIKSFDQLKRELGKQYSGDALWAKIAERAKKNTEMESVGCFVAGTLVHTREGLRPIEQIKVGDYVLSRPENGKGEVAYKRVVNTFEFEDKETWFVSWSDESLFPRLKTDLTVDQLIEAHGQSFVVTTPNHPFWVVSSPEYLDYDETYFYPRPYPQQQWVRADHVHRGMTLLLSDGRQVRVMEAKRVYKTDKALQGWVNPHYDDYGMPGLSIDFVDQKIQPCVPLLGYLHKPERSIYDGYVENPNKSYESDYPDDPNPESWYLSKVYNLEVEDNHTYFVDKLGVWVHNTNCGVGVQAGVQQVFTNVGEFEKLVESLPVGTYAVVTSRTLSKRPWTVVQSILDTQPFRDNSAFLSRTAVGEGGNPARIQA